MFTGPQNGLQEQGTLNFKGKIIMDISKVPLPSGLVFPFAGTVIPDGFLLCDGQTYSREAFKSLFNAIGINHGSDNGTTFRVPDYRGRFLRGVDGATARDPDRASRTAMNTGGSTGDTVGSVQGHQYASHAHDTPIGGTLTNGGIGSRYYCGVSYNETGNQNVSAAGGNETRPVNANVHYIIKV